MVTILEVLPNILTVTLTHEKFLCGTAMGKMTDWLYSTFIFRKLINYTIFFENFKHVYNEL